MFSRIARKAFKVAAIAVCALAASASLALFVAWAKRPSPNSAEGLLARADQFAWNNNWLAASPLYARAEPLFQAEGNHGRALYAHVSQFSLKMERSELSQLIAELNRDLASPSAAAPEIRLRVLEMKAKCEEEYDAGLAKQTFAEVERLALKRHKFFLASRASGEQGILSFTLGNLAEATARVKRAYAIAKFLGDPAAHVRYAEIIGLGIEQLGRPKQALVFLDEAIATQKRHPEVALPYVAYNAKIDSLADLGRYKEALALADQALVFPQEHHLYGQLQSLLTSRADVLARSGRFSDAIRGYGVALSDAKTLQSGRAINLIDGNLAAVYGRIGDLPKALSAINEAIEANKQTPAEIFLVPGNLAVKARIQSELGRRADAERLYVKGVDVLDALLAHVPTPETERLLLTELGDLYSGYFQLLSDEGRAGDAFEVIEQAHGRIEAQELEYDQTAVPRYDTSEDVALRQRELSLVDSDDRQNRMGILREVLDSEQPGHAQNSEEKPATLKAVQGQLHPGELLVEYVLASPHSYALAIRRSAVKRYTLPAKTEIERDVSGYRDRLRKQGADPHLGQQLYRELLGFTRGYPDAKSLIIVADGDLHLLPFSALVDEFGRYLVETKSVTMAPSGTVLNLLRARVETAAVNRPYLGVAPWTESSDEKPWILRAVSFDSKAADLPALSSPVMQREATELYQGLQLYQVNSTNLVAEPDQALPCGFPFEGPTSVQCIAIRLPGAVRDSPPRWLILQLERCSAPFPFERVIVDRDNDSAPGENAEDANLMPAWSKAGESVTDAGKSVPDSFQSNEEPRRGLEPLRIGLIEDRFEYLSGKTLIKEEKIVQRYRFMPMKTDDSQMLTGLGTGQGTWGASNLQLTKLTTVQAPAPKRREVAVLPASLETFIQAIELLGQQRQPCHC